MYRNKQLPLKGFFIGVEGLDGCGKTTQIERMRERLETHGYDVVVTKAPGGTALSDILRAAFLDHHRTCDRRVELGLLCTAMAETYHRVIQPALNAGKVVLCDRFYYTTYAYQGAGKGTSLLVIDQIREALMPTAEPDLWLYYRLSAIEAETRMGRRGGVRSSMDAAGIEFFKRVRTGFDELFSPQRVSRDGTRMAVVDADRSIDEVDSYGWRVVINRLTAWENEYQLARTTAPETVTS